MPAMGNRPAARPRSRRTIPGRIRTAIKRLGRAGAATLAAGLLITTAAGSDRTAAATDVVSTSPDVRLNVMEAPVVTEAPVPADDEDPELAAYNARLAALEAKGPKTWRNRETVVVRRAR